MHIMGGAIKSAARVNNSKASALLKCCCSILSKFKHQRVAETQQKDYFSLHPQGWDGAGLSSMNVKS